MSIRLLFCILAVLSASALPVQLASEPAVEILRSNSTTAKLISGINFPDLDDNSAGVKPLDGSIIDISNSKPPNSSVSEKLKLFAGETDKDITSSVLFHPPVVNIIYWFETIQPEDQCSYKIFLDGLLMIGDGPNIAFSDIPNGVCTGFNIHPVKESSIADLNDRNGYSRILLIKISGNEADSKYQPDGKLIGSQLSVMTNEFANRNTLAAKLGRFFRENTNGVFVHIPKNVAAKNEKIAAKIYRNDRLYSVFEFRSSSYLSNILRTRREYFIAVGSALLVSIFLVIITLRRRSRATKTVRRILIGRGHDVDVSLGDGDDGTLVILRVFRDRTIELEKQTSKIDVRLNGREVGRRAKMQYDDNITIDGKNIRFS
jgi:hypothetical protein